jgi:hypothetical protein
MLSRPAGAAAVASGTTRTIADRRTETGMPSVRLGRYELEAYPLPPVCMICGAEASLFLPKTFYSRILWLYPVILLGPFGALVFLLGLAVLRRRVRFPVPLCARHRHYWRVRNLATYGALSAVFVMTFGGVILLLVVARTFTGRFLDFYCSGHAAFLLIWLIGLWIIDKTTLRVIEITARGIYLGGVSRNFVRAVRRDRRGDISWEDEEDDS